MGVALTLALGAFGCTDTGSEPLAIVGASTSGQDDELVMLGVSSCGAEDIEVEVVSSMTTMLSLRVSGRRPVDENDCLDGVQVRLDGGLGDRSIVDETTGREVEVTHSE